MKILYISNSRIPTEKAHGIQIMKMCEAFGNVEVEIKLILPTRKNKDFEQINSFEYYRVNKKFKIKKIFTIDPYLLIKLPQGIYIKFQAVFYMISLFFYLLFIQNKQDYIFYTRDEYLLPMLQIFSKRIVWECHNLPFNRNKYIKYWNRCHKIICISENLKNELIVCGIDQSKILIAHDGVDLKDFDIKQHTFELKKELDIPQDKKIIMYTGHFYKWKGVQTLADAVRFLSKDYLFIFVGGGDHCFKDFKKRNSQSNILFTGLQEPHKIPLYLKIADILVLPNSAEDTKSFSTSPLKLFEYMAAGKPIVAADLSNIREVLDNKNAVFFEADNSRDLAQKIESIVEDNELSAKISKQAYEDVKQYTWSIRALNIVNFIK